MVSVGCCVMHALLSVLPLGACRHVHIHGKSSNTSPTSPKNNTFLAHPCASPQSICAHLFRMVLPNDILVQGLYQLLGAGQLLQGQLKVRAGATARTTAITGDTVSCCTAIARVLRI